MKKSAVIFWWWVLFIIKSMLLNFMYLKVMFPLCDELALITLERKGLHSYFLRVKVRSAMNITHVSVQVAFVRKGCMALVTSMVCFFRRFLPVNFYMVFEFLEFQEYFIASVTFHSWAVWMKFLHVIGQSCFGCISFVATSAMEPIFSLMFILHMALHILLRTEHLVALRTSKFFIRIDFFLPFASDIFFLGIFSFFHFIFDMRMCTNHVKL